jgi:hypothetical protein
MRKQRFFLRRLAAPLIERTRRDPFKHGAFKRDAMIFLAIRNSKVVSLLAALALFGCSTVYRVTNDNSHPQTNDISPEEFFARIGSDPWNILLVTGQQRTANILSAPGDSITLVSQQDSLTIPIRQIQSVSKKKSIEDLVVYPLAGMIGGALLGISLPSNNNVERGDPHLLTGTAIGIAGGLTLAIFFPPRIVYEFSQAWDHR